MSGGLFLDTSGWFAAVSPREPVHQAARTAYREEIEQGGVVVTTALVLAELHTLLLRFRGPRYALEFLDSLAADRTHEVVEVDRALRTASVDRWLRGFPDQRFSVADAVSFEVMRLRKLRRALALDTHFVVAGYEVVGQ
jgi:predicted nucleic acid-binding protein